MIIKGCWRDLWSDVLRKTNKQGELETSAGQTASLGSGFESEAWINKAHQYNENVL